MARVKFIPRIFGNRASDSNLFNITEKEFNYIKVTRIQSGDTIELFELSNNEVYNGVVANIRKNYIELEDYTVAESKVSDKVEIDLAFGICSKENSRDVIDYGVQVGVKNFFPFIASHSHKNGVSFVKNRGEDMLYEALRQCKSNIVPTINEVVKADKISQIYSNYENIIIADPQEESIINFELNRGKTLLIIGPESGFEQKDIDKLLKDNVIKASFFGNTMRAQVAVASIYGQLTSILNI